MDILQECDPPDIFWPIALVLRLRKVQFVFDHHDLLPELYESRFFEGCKVLFWGLACLSGVSIAVPTTWSRPRFLQGHWDPSRQRVRPRGHGREDRHGPSGSWRPTGPFVEEGSTLSCCLSRRHGSKTGWISHSTPLVTSSTSWAVTM